MRARPLRSAPEVDLLTIVAILLGVFWLGVLITVGFTAWRLLANLKALLRSVSELSERLAPTLEELADKGQEAAELAARLQKRQRPPAAPLSRPLPERVLLKVDSSRTSVRRRENPRRSSSNARS
jgi:hypothetical protein